MGETVFDYKKEYRDLYMPKDKPVLIEVPPMNFLMVDGSGDPNNSPEFQQATELLYGLSYTIKMIMKKGKQPDGYFEYVVPPLEGLWWIEEGGFSFEKRDNWKWTLMIRQPEFVDESVFDWACEQLRKKKGLETSRARLWRFREGLCAQMMHIGPYDTEPASVAHMDAFLAESGYRNDLGSGRHHEIYLGDPSKTAPEKLKTVLRHPVAKI